MKKQIIALMALLVTAQFSMAEVMTLKCKTEKGTDLNLTYDSWSKQTSRPELISLTIAGKEMSGLLDGRFGTSGGRPTFRLASFPQAGMTTSFNIYTQGTYTVFKNGSMSGEDHPIQCQVIKAEAAKVDTSF